MFALLYNRKLEIWRLYDSDDTILYGGRDFDVALGDLDTLDGFIQTLIDNPLNKPNEPTGNSYVPLMGSPRVTEQYVGVLQNTRHWTTEDNGTTGVIPLPPAGWMLVSAIVALGAFKSRRSVS